MIKIGNRVEVIDKFDNLLLKGWKGKIILISEDLIGVEFENKIPNNSGHDCGGQGKSGYCRYGEFYETKLLPEDWDD